MFLKRSYETEIMDDFSIKDGRIDLALQELNLVSMYLGGERVSASGIKRILKKKSCEKIKILDAGAGTSLPFLSAAADNSNRDIFCLDKNIRVCKYLKRTSSSLKIICGDILNAPFKKQYFDIIHASLILHHFNENQLNTILRLFKKTSKLGIVINDLRRNIFAYLGIKILIYLFSKSEMIKNDAPISVRRGFVKSELLELLHSNDIFNYEIKRKWAFRWLLVIYL